MTVTKAQLMALLKDLPDDAEIYVMATMLNAQKTIAAANMSKSEDVSFRVASTNVLREAHGVSLIAYV